MLVNYNFTIFLFDDALNGYCVPPRYLRTLDRRASERVSQPARPPNLFHVHTFVMGSHPHAICYTKMCVVGTERRRASNTKG